MVADRERILEEFRDGKIKVLSNVDLFGEGFDLPAIETVILLRPTKSLSLYLQQVGRGQRTYPGKDYAIILDHAGNWFRHGMLDAERKWTLEGRKKGQRISTEPIIPVKNCPSCHAVLPASKIECYCGHVWVADGRTVKEVDGELVEITKDELKKIEKSEQAQCRSEEDLVMLGRKRGYEKAEAWAAHVWRSREEKKKKRRKF